MKIIFKISFIFWHSVHSFCADWLQAIGKPMTLQKFNALTQTQQYEILLESAVYLSNRSDNNFNYILYQIGAFYIEVKFDLVANDFITYHAFEDTTELDPYLSIIDLHEVLN